MSKVQGKQIDDNTITQNNLNLSTPLSGDTLSGATVEYVNTYISEVQSSGVTIGPAEDGSYTDGIFTDFTPNTKIGVVVDRFNEILLKIAPAPPSDFGSVLMNISGTNYTPRQLTTGGVVTSPMITNTTPLFVVSVPTQGLADATSGLLTFDVDSNTQETYTVIGESGKTSGVIRFTAGDPYVGQTGKAGIWSGFTAVSAISTTLTPNSSLKTANYTHSTKGTITRTFYLDSPLAVTIDSLSATIPTMTRYISGVPSLSVGDTISNITFNINNVSSYFYAPTYVWEIQAGLVAQVTGDPDVIPTSYGEISIVANKSTTVLTNQFSDTSFSFNIGGRNSLSANGVATTFSDNGTRVDTVSNETSRVTSGAGSYPSTGYNGVYDSTESLKVGDYVNELMLKNGLYQYPNGDYTIFGGPDYSTGISGTRWVTFNIGTFTNNSAFTLNIGGSTGISAIGQANLLIEVKIDGSSPSSWVDGDAAYSGVGSPGSGADGVAAVVTGSSTATSRRITFGSVVHTGSIIVRIGFTGSGLSFTTLSATSIV